MQAGTDEGISYEGPGAVELVTRLNERYGVDDPRPAQGEKHVKPECF